MKQILKTALIAFIMAPVIFFTSCEDNLETSCDDFLISIDFAINDTTSVSLTAITEGGTPDFTYAWNTGETTETITVTEFATYSVVVTDANDCVASIDFSVEADSTTTVDCDSLWTYITEDAGSSTSELTANTSGGSGVYSYLWSTGETTESITVTNTGTYGVAVTDDEGCIVNAVYNYVQGEICNYDVSIELNIDPITSDTTFTVVIDTFDMNGSYSYQWFNGETTASIGSSGYGVYTVTVVDGNGCIFVVSYNFEGGNLCDGFDVNILSFPDSTSTQITLATDIIAETYMWSTGELSSVIEVEQGSGEYSVTVTDENDCVAEDTIEI